MLSEPRRAAETLPLADARYADEWVVGTEDVTLLATEVHSLVRAR